MTHSPLGTPPKITLLSVCLGNSVGRAAAAGATEYHHWDANAGNGPHTGAYVLNGLPIKTIASTPDLIFRKATDRRWRHLSFTVTLIERHRTRVLSLRDHVQRKWGPEFNTTFFDDLPRVRLRILRGDNNRILPALLEGIPEEAYGSLLLDPTGCSPRGGAIDIGILKAVCAAVPRFTVLLQFPHGFARRVWGWNRAHPERPFPTQHLNEYLPLRPYWVISEPFGRQNAHLVVAGSYYQMGDWREGALRLHRLTSGRGQELIRICDELPEEPSS